MIEAKNERFWSCIDRNAKVTLAVPESAEGLAFSRIGYLLFSQPASGRIKRRDVEQHSVYRENLSSPGRLTFDHQGRLLCCLKDRVIRVEKNGAVSIMADSLQSATDVVYAIDGSIYIADSQGSRVLQVTRERGGVGGTAAKGSVRAVATNCSKPNGVALSPNQQHLYVSDPGTTTIRVYPVNGDGTLGAGRDFAKFEGFGLKTDEAGNVWIASADGVSIFDSKGEILGLVRTPQAAVNLNWGSGFRGLYIAAANAIFHVPTKANGTRTY